MNRPRRSTLPPRRFQTDQAPSGSANVTRQLSVQSDSLDDLVIIPPTQFSNVVTAQIHNIEELESVNDQLEQVNPPQQQINLPFDNIAASHMASFISAVPPSAVSAVSGLLQNIIAAMAASQPIPQEPVTTNFNPTTIPVLNNPQGTPRSQSAILQTPQTPHLTTTQPVISGVLTPCRPTVAKKQNKPQPQSIIQTPAASGGTLPGRDRARPTVASTATPLTNPRTPSGTAGPPVTLLEPCGLAEPRPRGARPIPRADDMLVMSPEVPIGTSGLAKPHAVAGTSARGATQDAGEHRESSLAVDGVLIGGQRGNKGASMQRKQAVKKAQYYQLPQRGRSQFRGNARQTGIRRGRGARTINPIRAMRPLEFAHGFHIRNVVAAQTHDQQDYSSNIISDAGSAISTAQQQEVLLINPQSADCGAAQTAAQLAGFINPQRYECGLRDGDVCQTAAQPTELVINTLRSESGLHVAETHKSSSMVANAGLQGVNVQTVGQIQTGGHGHLTAMTAAAGNALVSNLGQNANVRAQNNATTIVSNPAQDAICMAQLPAIDNPHTQEQSARELLSLLQGVLHSKEPTKVQQPTAAVINPVDAGAAATTSNGQQGSANAIAIPSQQPEQVTSNTGQGLSANSNGTVPGVKRIWIVGHSFVHWASLRCASLPIGQSLGFPSNKVSIRWLGDRGMCWPQLAGTLSEALVHWGKPHILILHLGGNDVGAMPVLQLIKVIQADISCLRVRIPGVMIGWSNIVPRLHWRHMSAHTAAYRIRKRSMHHWQKPSQVQVASWYGTKPFRLIELNFTEGIKFISLMWV
ncbi:uncharacterized protein LOC128644734 [Bombina bombina]|uniref:uncharacterized protein LOC128644734 n=1 Tax=Bombina bombina TaxID=8345 RepID=UPI00235A50FE|nr:uncharacterized protein LOC128644734 [Bombina bombina]